MTNVDNFKSFVKKNPNLISYVRNGNMTWQKFYEIYDLYGEDDDVWKEYIVKSNSGDTGGNNKVVNNVSTSSPFSSILEMAKNIDANRLQDGITSLQKAISLFGDMLIKDKPEVNNYTPRPIYRKFDD